MTSMTDLAALVVSRIDPGVRVDLGQQLGTAIEANFPLKIQESASFAQRGDGGWCDGLSILRAGLIFYRRTETRRQNFTLMHELGHHLVDNDEDCIGWYMDQDQDEADRQLELLCNKIAALLLVPQELRDSLLIGRPLDAAAAIDLREATEASLSCCSIIIADRLPCDGFVTISDPGADQLFFASHTRDTHPRPWSRSDISPAHPLRNETIPARTVSWWPRPDGSRREYYQSTALFRGKHVAVFAANDLWNTVDLHAGTYDIDRGNDGWVTCPCGYKGGTRMYPCHACGTIECPRCRECACQRRARIEPTDRCRECTTQVRTHLLVDGYCDACR